MLLNAIQLAGFTRIRDALMADQYGTDHTPSSWLDPEHIDRFLERNPAGLAADELDCARQWRTAVPGPFFVMRHTGSCSIFMNHLGTFAVRGTECELARLVPQTPTLVEATLVPFDGLIVCAEDPRFDPAEAGEADHAAIDATYRGLVDKGVIYSAAVMSRLMRGVARQAPVGAGTTPQPMPVGAEPAYGARPVGLGSSGSPVHATAGSGDDGQVPARVAHRGLETALPTTKEGGRGSSTPADELAPVEMITLEGRRRPAAHVPAGLAQIIAFKPRAAARAALS